MTTSRPLALTVLGYLSLGFALAWIFWLALARYAVLLDLFGAGLGEDRAISELARLHLASPGAVYVTLLTLLLELLLAVILLASGLGLLGQRPWARWSLLFYCAWVILVEAGSTLAQAFFLTPATERLALAPVLVNGVTILTAIVLWGMAYLPGIESAGPASDEPGP